MSVVMKCSAHRSFRPGLALVLLGLAVACAPTRPQPASRESGPIPVVRPFALERAGSHAKFGIELPDTREDGRLREVFIGFRAVHDPRPADSFQKGRPVMRYLMREPIPIRLEVHRWTGNAWQPVTMMKLGRDGKGQATHYVPHEDTLYRRHRPAHWDGGELIDAGLWNHDLIYLEHEIAAFHTPAPGRYRVAVTNLEAHPLLEGMPYQIVVAHSRRY